MQYDSKHNFFKRVVHDVVNFKNIVIMLSTQHQQMMAFYFDGKSLLKPKLCTASVDKIHIASLEEKLSKPIQNKFSQQYTVSRTKDVHLHGTHYAKGMIISAGQCSGLSEFNKLLNIVIHFENVFFVTTKFSSWLMEHYRSAKVVGTHCLDVEILDLEDLNDYQPQTVYQVAG